MEFKKPVSQLSKVSAVNANHLRMYLPSVNEPDACVYTDTAEKLFDWRKRFLDKFGDAEIKNTSFWSGLKCEIVQGSSPAYDYWQKEMINAKSKHI